MDSKYLSSGIMLMACVGAVALTTVLVSPAKDARQADPDPQPSSKTAVLSALGYFAAVALAGLFAGRFSVGLSLPQGIEGSYALAATLAIAIALAVSVKRRARPFLFSLIPILMIWSTQFTPGKDSLAGCHGEQHLEGNRLVHKIGETAIDERVEMVVVLDKEVWINLGECTSNWTVGGLAGSIRSLAWVPVKEFNELEPEENQSLLLIGVNNSANHLLIGREGFSVADVTSPDILVGLRVANR